MPAVPILTATLMRPQGDTGVQTHVGIFHAWLAAQGLPAQLVTPFAAPAWQIVPVFGLRRLVDVLSKPWSVWWYRRWHAHFLRATLRRALADGAPCVVYAQCPVSAAAALEARRSPAQRVVLVVHFNLSQALEWQDKGMLPASHPVFRGIQALESRVLCEVDGLVFVSDFMRREILARNPAAAKVASAVIPNFVDDPLDTPSGPVDGDLIAIGTLEPRKNQGFLLDVLACCRRRGRRYTLSLVGDGPDADALRARAVALGLTDQVRFLGRQSQAARLIGRHRALVHGALMENLPITLVEAMAYGRPVLAAAVGGIPEVLEHGVQGFHWPLDAPQRAAELLEELLESQALWDSMAVAARARFLRNFETEGVAPRLAAFLHGTPPHG